MPPTGILAMNLDTNIVIFALKGLLSDQEQQLLRGRTWSISPIVLWELAILVDRRNLELDLDSDSFSDFVKSVKLLPIDLRVARVSTQLDFRSNPADELIAATSIVYGIPLLTRDRVISMSKLVPLAR